MALQYSVAVRNAQLDALETTIGTAPTVEIGNGKTGQAGILGVRGHEERVTLGTSVEVEGRDGTIGVGR